MGKPKRDAKSDKQSDRIVKQGIKAQKEAIGKHRRNEVADDDDSVLSNQLKACSLNPVVCNIPQCLGLKLRDMRGDGNCLFRALADQLYGDASRHPEMRREAIDFMAAHEQDFAPFVVDTTFAKHLAHLSKEGIYGGNEAIVAIARARRVNVVIHQAGQPRWEVHGNDFGPPVAELHIVYHSYEHLRRLAGDVNGPALVVLPNEAARGGAGPAPDGKKEKAKKDAWNLGEEEAEELAAAMGASLEEADMNGNANGMESACADGGVAGADGAGACADGASGFQDNVLEMIMAATDIKDVGRITEALAKANGDVGIAIATLSSFDEGSEAGEVDVIADGVAEESAKESAKESKEDNKPKGAASSKSHASSARARKDNTKAAKKQRRAEERAAAAAAESRAAHKEQDRATVPVLGDTLGALKI